jgi:hypothetical protein
MILHDPLDRKRRLQSRCLGKRQASSTEIASEAGRGAERAPGRTEMRAELDGAALELHRFLKTPANKVAQPGHG